MSDGTLAQLNPSPRFRGELLNRIYRVWLFRKWLPIFGVEVVALAALLYWLGKVVFLQRVIENALNVIFTNPPAALSFFVAAFANASVVTKVLTAIAAVATALLVRHFTQGVLRLILVRQNYFGRTDNGSTA